MKTAALLGIILSGLLLSACKKPVAAAAPANPAAPPPVAAGASAVPPTSSPSESELQSEVDGLREEAKLGRSRVDQLQREIRANKEWIAATQEELKTLEAYKVKYEAERVRMNAELAELQKYWADKMGTGCVADDLPETFAKMSALVKKASDENVELKRQLQELKK